MTPRDISVEVAVAIAAVAVVGARWIVTKGPIHVALWILAIGAIVLATTKFSSEVLE